MKSTLPNAPLLFNGYPTSQGVTQLVERIVTRLPGGQRDARSEDG
jgi:hypothetical protein